MFTGIVESIGTIQAINISGEGARVNIHVGNMNLSDVNLGDSIATNGVCLTVVAFDENSFSADVSLETLKRSGLTQYKTGDKVNLEKAMLPTTRFGGHMVSGHVDAVSQIVSIEHQGNSSDYWLAMPTELAHYIAEKGSITIDGTSLTVNGVSTDRFRLTIVPHTVAQTIISQYQVGTKVNVEVDLIARYIERLLTKNTTKTADASGITLEQLARSGFMKSSF